MIMLALENDISMALSEMDWKGARLEDTVTIQARDGALGLQENLLVNTTFPGWVSFLLLTAWDCAVPGFLVDSFSSNAALLKVWSASDWGLSVDFHYQPSIREAQKLSISIHKL